MSTILIVGGISVDIIPVVERVDDDLDRIVLPEGTVGIIRIHDIILLFDRHVEIVIIMG